MEKEIILSDKLIKHLGNFPSGASIGELQSGIDQVVSDRTIQRLLKKLSTEGLIEITGSARSTRYHLIRKQEVEHEFPGVNPVKAINKNNRIASVLIPLSKEGRDALSRITAPIQQRIPVGYHPEFLMSYQPNTDGYLSEQEKQHLANLGQTGDDRPAGTYALQILNRLLIDLAWNSSRLEGNTYSLLDTERLIVAGEIDETKSEKEAQMILNHKDAIEFIVQSADEIGFNRHTLLNIHGMLASNLLADPEAPGRLRSMPVAISGSTFTPVAIPQLIEEYFNSILEKSSLIKNPFEQSFFLMIHLPYLQPFDDVNKRVSRLAANIPMVKNNLCPLSFVDVPEDLYIQGMKAVYEFNEVGLLKDVFLWAYERSAQKYKVIRQSIGEPDPFKLKYRTKIRDLISQIMFQAMNVKEAKISINTKAALLPNDDQQKFINAVETELMALHEGNFARYRVSLKEFIAWQKMWKS